MKLAEAYHNIKGLRANPKTCEADLKIELENLISAYQYEGEEGIQDLINSDNDFDDTLTKILFEPILDKYHYEDIVLALFLLIS